MEALHLHFAWAWMLTGMVAGAGMGLFFHRSDWLGGFDAWPRRMVRLAHIAFLGTGLLNVAFAVSIPVMMPLPVYGAPLRIASVLLLVGAVSMPAVCLLAAWRRPFRHLFFIPASSLIGAAAVICLGS